jgi:transposase InsO family protein
VKYALIHRHEGQHAVALMCRVLTVSRSGYYGWRGRPPSDRAKANARLAAEVRRVYADHKARAGAPRITKHLREEGQKVGKNRVARVMRTEQLRAKAARKYKATTNSNHNLPVAPNLLKQDFTATAPNRKWVSDITYIATDEGWLYLAVVLDLYSRLVVGWAMSERMTAKLVCDALQMALWRRKRPRGVIVHSDRGSQYCSGDYQRLLRDNGLVCSMSKKGDCYDNAVMESWNHSLKVEAIHGERFGARQMAKDHVFEYIEVYYNRKRLHSRLGYLSPEAFELRYVA